MKISSKLTTGFGVVVAAVLVTSGTMLVANTNVIRLGKLSDRMSDARFHAGYANLLQVRQKAEARGYLIEPQDAVKARYAEAGVEFRATIRQLRQDLSNGDRAMLGAVSRFEAAHAAWEDRVGTPTMKLGSTPATLEQGRALAVSATANKLNDDCREQAGALGQEIDSYADRVSGEAAACMNMMRIMAVLGSLLASLAALLVGFVLNRMIAKPVAGMTLAMKALAAGDNAVSIPAVGRRDEVGEMADTVQVFKEAALTKLRVEAEAAKARREVEDGRKRSEAAAALATEKQRTVVEFLANGLDRLSSGDLAHRLTTPFAADYEKLRTDFNVALGSLQDTMKLVAGAASVIQSGSEEVCSAADDLSRRTEQQAASLEETAAALNEITTTVRKTADGAEHAREVVGRAKTDAERSGEVVREAIAAMTGIETSSAEIGQVTGIINEIAFQINLLALNAGVEAARAGDAGRGFAVVASEVRALAQRSGEAAKEINARIAASTQQVKSGVRLVGETRSALDRIVTGVSEINAIVVEIAASARDQAASLQQVNIAINQMDQVTQQNAAMVEESTAASHALTSESEGLGSLIGRFRLDATHAVPDQADAPRRLLTA